jgi:hypothetical protein
MIISQELDYEEGSTVMNVNYNGCWVTAVISSYTSSDS